MGRRTKPRFSEIKLIILKGAGAFGMPGDFAPPAIFIRTLFNKLTVKKVSGEGNLLIQANNILNSVKIPRGSVVTNKKLLTVHST